MNHRAAVQALPGIDTVLHLNMRLIFAPTIKLLTLGLVTVTVGMNEPESLVDASCS